ncbi:MAG: hypothetical protein ACTSXD_01460, partial [Candidatus Heimdallarchaeaceae archaeon]
MNQNEIAWDLTELFDSAEDPTLKERVEWLHKTVDEIKQKYKGKINSSDFTENQLLELLRDIEELMMNLSEYAQFASLTFSANMTTIENQKLFNEMREITSEIEKKLAFVDIELGKLL